MQITQDSLSWMRSPFRVPLCHLSRGTVKVKHLKTSAAGTGWQDGRWSSVVCRTLDLDVRPSGKLQKTDDIGGQKIEGKEDRQLAQQNPVSE